MFLTIIVIAALAILSFVVFFLKKNEKEQAYHAVNKTPSKLSKEKTKTVTPSQALSTFNLEEEDSIIPEDGFSTINRIIKDNVQAGMENIYTTQYTTPYPFVPPWEYRNVSPETIRTVHDQLTRLKNFRSVHEHLQQIINDPRVQISDISKLVTSDPVLTTKILKLVNSPYFGIPKKIDSISHAMLILGIVNVKNILYREGLLQLLLTNDPEKNKLIEKIWRHATLTAICATHLHSLFGGLNQGSLYTMGLLHDIGKLILLMMPTQTSSNQINQPEGNAVYLSLDQEDRLFGINHAVIAGIALSEWGLSDLMVNVVANHHVLSYKERSSLKMDGAQFSYLFVLFIADQIAKQIGGDLELNVDNLHPSYHHVIDRNQLQDILQENIFLSQVRESDAIVIRPPAGGSSSLSSKEGPDFREKNMTVVKTESSQNGNNGDATVVLYPAKAKSTIGRYEILSVLGQGAMGTVYLGRDPMIQRTVAIKTMRYGDGEDLSMSRSRFFREAEAIGSLSHPNIVTIYDVGEDRGIAYIAMEYLDGCDLSKYCEKEKLLPYPEVARIGREVALALHYAHERGVVHRDIKPANIRLSSGGSVKVTDFGIARVVDLSVTQVGTILGTPNYMSPEQIKGEAVDGRADLFSLGVVLYELLTGDKPFKGDSITTVMNNIANKSPAPIGEKVPSVSETIAAVVEKAIRKNRDERYQSGRELAEDLDALRN